jgi:vancomycin resistance protein YoaR
MSRKNLFIIGGVPLALIVLIFGAFLVDRAIAADEIARRVSVAGIDVGGLGQTDALAQVTALETELLSARPIFRIEGEEFVLDPARAGLDVDEESVVAAAMDARRDLSLFAQFKDWLGSGDPVDIPLPVTVDPDKVEAVLVSWENEAIDQPAYDGAVVISGGRAVPDYPRRGRVVDRSSAVDTVMGVLLEGSALPTDLPVVDSEPRLTVGEIDAAVQEANLLIGSDIVLAAVEPEIEFTFSSTQLAAALESRIVQNSPTTIELAFDPEDVAALLAPHIEAIEQPPLDATFVIVDADPEDEDSEPYVEIVPGRPATIFDPELVTAALHEAALAPDRTGEFPFAYGEEPEFPTEDAEAMGPITLVSEWTTYHPAGQPRVINIHTMADTIDGDIVWPGEEYSINEVVGPRTLEKGFVEAPMILAGEMVDSVGGGVSQYATTFFNAVFFGCYEDVEHRPHSLYFSRYPEGREATINYPGGPELIFRNNTEAVVVIDNEYTDTSITVRFFGNNGGKTCESVSSGRYAYTDPPTKYLADPNVPPGEEVVESNGYQGWSITVTRVITHPDGTVEEEPMRHAYNPSPREVRVHPCMLPGDHEEYTGEECPVQVPTVVGFAIGDAQAAIEAAGFAFVLGDAIEVSAESGLEGVVAAQSPAADEWLPLGETVTVNLGVVIPPPPEEGDGGEGDGEDP